MAPDTISWYTIHICTVYSQFFSVEHFSGKLFHQWMSAQCILVFIQIALKMSVCGIFVGYCCDIQDRTKLQNKQNNKHTNNLTFPLCVCVFVCVCVCLCVMCLNCATALVYFGPVFVTGKSKPIIGSTTLQFVKSIFCLISLSLWSVYCEIWLPTFIWNTSMCTSLYLLYLTIVAMPHCFLYTSLYSILIRIWSTQSHLNYLCL